MTRKIVMNKLKEILTRLSRKESYSQIERALGVSHALIGKIKKRICELETTAEELLKLKDLELQSKFYPPRKAIRRVPDWNEVYQKSKKKKVSLLLIYEELYCKEEDANGSPPMAYSTFCQNFDLWKKEHGILNSHSNVAREPGEQLQIDYAGKPIQWIDTNGVRHVSQVFVACLPASGLLFAYATSNQTRTDWMDGVIAALEYIGGSPRCLVVDNAKALVSKADRYEAIFPMQIKSLCAYYKMTPDACKPRKPQEKSGVESSVGYVEEHVIAKLGLKGPVVAKDINELNKKIKEQCDIFNLRPLQRNRTHSRRSLFELGERANLNPLPKFPYEKVETRCLRVDNGHCVRINSDCGHRYSVPSSYAGKIVLVLLTKETVECFNMETGASLGLHVREYNAIGNKTHILKEHLTDAESAIRWTPEKFKLIFFQKGAPQEIANKFVDGVFASVNKSTAVKRCLGLTQLQRKTKREIFNNALELAILYDTCSYRYVKESIKEIELRREQDKHQGQLFDENGNKKELGEKEDYNTPEHDNIRDDYD